jgi:hypothetical protein
MGYPPKVSRKGKAPPLERGKGRYSPPANLERVIAKALKRGVKGPFPLVSEALLEDMKLRGFSIVCGYKLRESFSSEDSNNEKIL